MRTLIYLIIILFIAACGSEPLDKKAELAKLRKDRAALDKQIAQLEAEVGGNDSAKVVQVGALTIEPGTFTSYIEVQGTLDADENVMAYAEAPGVINSISVRPGQQVSKGQVLVHLDTKALQQQIASAEAQVELANSLFQRQKNLWDQKIGTEVQFIQARTNRDIATKQLAGLRAQASMYSIKSPISGVVDQMDLKVGQAIQPGMNGIRIVNLNKLKVKANIPETYASKLDQGDVVVVFIPDAGDSIRTTLTYVSKVIDPASRSFNVEVRLPGGSHLKPNMTAVLNIIDAQRSNSIVLPIKAIQKSEQGEYVYVAENNKAKRIEIKTGNTYRGEAEVLSGLQAGQKVIIDGAQNLEEGDTVQII